MSALDPAPVSSDDLGSRLEFETLISDTSAALFAVPPEALEGAVERALVRVRQFFHADRCALLSVSADQQIVNVRVASYADGVAPVPPDVNLAEAFPWSRQKLLIERVPIRITRFEDLPPEALVERASWQAMPIRSALTLPIEAGGVVRHLVVLNTVHHERDWLDVFVTRLRVLGEMLASALERQALFLGLRDAEARLASGAHLAGLGYYEVHFADGVMYTDERLRDLCGIPPDRVGVQALEFWMEHLHPDERERILDLREQMHSGSLERLSVEYAYLHPERGEMWIQHLAGASVRDAAGRAVITYGVLRDITPGKRAEDELRDLSRRLIRAHEEERALLARELHDDFTQRLAVLAIDLGRAELVATGAAHAEMLRSTREAVTRLSEDIHSLAYQLHPSVLEELGLAQALETECERVGRQWPLQLSVQLDELSSVGKDASLCLFRVAQGALSNVIHHASARSASVVLRRMDGGLLLAVRDDGVGFDPSDPRRARSLGLSSMRERLRLVNGTLDVESAQGEGTSIIAWVPLEAAP